MKLIICDDEIKDAQKAEGIISKMSRVKELDIEIMSPHDVFNAVEDNLFKCDIVVVDIQYEGEEFDGIELAQRINKKYPVCQIVYLTNILDFAPFVYETEHCYFVMKENMDIMLPRAIEKAVEGHKNIGNDVVEFLSNGHKVFVTQNEIIYIERNDRVLNINTLKKTYQCYTSLRKIEDKLGSAFARCHSGFIVNMSCISGIDGTEIILKDGRKIPIGMRFFENFKMKYLKYYSDRM